MPMKAGKVIFGLLAVCGIVWGIVGCTQKENEIPTPKLTVTEKVDADFESVTLYCLATEIPDSAYLDNWTASVAASGAFVKSVNMNDWQIGERGIPSGWTIENE